MITTVSRTLAQQIVNTVQDICGHDINFINRKGIIFASTNEERIGTFHEIGKKAADTMTAIEVAEEDNYEGTSKGVNIPISHDGAFIAVIGISGEPESVRKYAYLAERITRLLIREQEVNAAARTLTEKKSYLIQVLLSENPAELGTEELSRIEELLAELRIDRTVKKRVLLYRLHPAANAAVPSSAEMKLCQMFERLKISLYCFQYPNEYVGILDEPVFEQNHAQLKGFADSNTDILSAGVGCADHLLHLAHSYSTAQIALKSASSDKPFVLFDDMDLEILLASLSTRSKEAFLAKTLSLLSEEEKELLRVYFEEGRSLLRTSEKLFLHKNTLQYKLDRIHRISGLNPRDFKDSVLLYLAVLLKYTIPE